jgi:hypothetical protein
MTAEQTAWIAYLLGLLLSVGAGAAKGRAFSGFLWGLLFGPVGLLVVLLALPDLAKRRKKEAAEAAAMAAWRQHRAAQKRPGG